MARKRVGGGEARVEFDRAPQQRSRFALASRRRTANSSRPAQEAIVGFQIVGVRGGDALTFAGA